MQIKPDDIEFPEDDEDDKPLRRSRAKKKRKKSGQVGEGEWFEPTVEPKTKPLDDTVELSDLELSVGIKRNKVWPLTQFFSVSFLCKFIDLPGGQINDPSSGKHYSLPFLPATPSSPSCALLPQLQRYKGYKP